MSVREVGVCMAEIRKTRSGGDIELWGFPIHNAAGLYELGQMGGGPHTYRQRFEASRGTNAARLRSAFPYVSAGLIQHCRLKSACDARPAA